MNGRIVKIAQKIGVVFILAGFVFPGCESNTLPETLKIDSNPPEIHWITPHSGYFIKEHIITFEANVTSDIEITKVEIYYRQDQRDDWKTMTMNYDQDIKVNCPHCELLGKNEINASIYTFNLETGNVEHWVVGDKPFLNNNYLYVYIVAEDDEGNKTSSEANSYMLKTNPPQISVIIPFLEPEFWHNNPGYFIGHNGEHFYNWEYQRRPIVYYKGDIYCFVADIQGVKAPYPKIKIWDPNAGENEDTYDWDDIKPDHYTGHLDWENCGNNGEIIGSTIIGFQVRMFKRGPDGKVDLFNPTPMEKTIGFPYKFRIKAYDVGDSPSWDMVTGQLIEGGNNPIVSYYPPLDFPAAEFFIVEVPED